ncbi:hypothetical protein HPB50_010871 [Hyalomma asiaticum]|uniref:Uncharacterized protein n=1 Tax=Hyalomma asiaticum TaxID=266040 RepID=A0ACB7RIM3_HYAAI|nr:hypothetical protein HPB50_010871 [Hyalomma asiaticum]
MRPEPPVGPALSKSRRTMFSNAALRCGLCIVITWVCLATSYRPTPGKSSRPPHIIFILADDLGWNDVSFHGSRQIPTPNIDALAASGVILQRHYTSPDCTPSRTALMTARYPSRTDVGYEVFPPAAKEALSLRFELLPQWLKRLGYSTHMVGKWHLGYKSHEHTPTWRGFDTFFGYYNGQTFYFNHTVTSGEHCGVDLWRNAGHSTKSAADLNGTYTTYAFNDEAKRIIAEHDVRKPLFLYMAHEAGHSACENCVAEAPKDIAETFTYIKSYNRTTLAGYKSHEHTPTWRGFDTFFGYYNGQTFYFNHTVTSGEHCGVDLWRNAGHSTKSAADLNGTYTTYAFNDEAKRIIAEHDVRKPLFLYMAHEAGHSACENCVAEAPKDIAETFTYIKSYNRTTLAGAIHVMDRSVGELLTALQSRGMLADSVVVFASDNGGGPLASEAATAANSGSNWPLRGVKQELWEGGVRTPAAFWYGRLSGTLPRTPSQQVMHISDWAPTLYAAAGGDPRDLGDIDGRDQWDALSTGRGDGREEVLLDIQGKQQESALISGRYKLMSRPSGPSDPQLDTRVAPPQGQPPDDLDLDDLMTSSAAWKALQDASIDSGGQSQSTPRANWRQEATLNCSASPSDHSMQSNFDPYDEVFVFDIFSDPCELHNLAQSNTELRDELLKKLDVYRRAISPRPSNSAVDERGYPEHHRCLWTPWIHVKPAPYQNCSC